MFGRKWRESVDRDVEQLAKRVAQQDRELMSLSLTASHLDLRCSLLESRIAELAPEAQEREAKSECPACVSEVEARRTFVRELLEARDAWVSPREIEDALRSGGHSVPKGGTYTVVPNIHDFAERRGYTRAVQYRAKKWSEVSR